MSCWKGSRRNSSLALQSDDRKGKWRYEENRIRPKIQNLQSAQGTGLLWIQTACAKNTGVFLHRSLVKDYGKIFSWIWLPSHNLPFILTHTPQSKRRPLIKQALDRACTLSCEILKHDTTAAPQTTMLNLNCHFFLFYTLQSHIKRLSSHT